MLTVERWELDPATNEISNRVTLGEACLDKGVLAEGRCPDAPIRRTTPVPGDGPAMQASDATPSLTAAENWTNLTLGVELEVIREPVPGESLRGAATCQHKDTVWTADLRHSTTLAPEHLRLGDTHRYSFYGYATDEASSCELVLELGPHELGTLVRGSRRAADVPVTHRAQRSATACRSGGRWEALREATRHRACLRLVAESPLRLRLRREPFVHQLSPGGSGARDPSRAAARARGGCRSNVREPGRADRAPRRASRGEREADRPPPAELKLHHGPARRPGRNPRCAPTARKPARRAAIEAWATVPSPGPTSGALAASPRGAASARDPSSAVIAGAAPAVPAEAASARRTSSDAAAAAATETGGGGGSGAPPKTTARTAAPTTTAPTPAHAVRLAPANNVGASRRTAMGRPNASRRRLAPGVAPRSDDEGLGVRRVVRLTGAQPLGERIEAKPGTAGGASRSCPGGGRALRRSRVRSIARGRAR